MISPVIKSIVAKYNTDPLNDRLDGSLQEVKEEADIRSAIAKLEWDLHTIDAEIKKAEDKSKLDFLFSHKSHMLSEIGRMKSQLATMESRSIQKSTGSSLELMSAPSLASAVASGYHGYKRNESVAWAIGWFALGAFFPIITPTIALAQGFGDKKK